MNAAIATPLSSSKVIPSETHSQEVGRDLESTHQGASSLQEELRTVDDVKEFATEVTLPSAVGDMSESVHIVTSTSDAQMHKSNGSPVINDEALDADATTLMAKRGSNKGGKSHKDAYKETHVAFLKLFVEDKPFAEIQYILGLKKAQMDKHVSDAISKGVMPGKPQYRCALWEDLGPEVRATMTNGCKGKLVKIEGDPDSVMITLYDPQLALN